MNGGRSSLNGYNLFFIVFDARRNIVEYSSSNELNQDQILYTLACISQQHDWADSLASDLGRFKKKKKKKRTLLWVEVWPNGNWIRSPNLYRLRRDLRCTRCIIINMPSTGLQLLHEDQSERVFIRFSFDWVYLIVKDGNHMKSESFCFGFLRHFS